MRKIISIMILLVLLVGCQKNDPEKLIVTTNFPCYDLVRAITKDSDWKVEMLLQPGSDIHNFEPTPKNIIDIENSQLFVYTGGESDTWASSIMEKKQMSDKTIKLMDLVNLIPEDDEEMDEHVWTSPENYMEMLEKITKKIIDIDKNNQYLYEKNRDNYLKEIKEIDYQIKKIVNNSPKKTLIFGDRFPLIYFTNTYLLSYYAAFPGCSDATEVSAKTLSFLIEKIKEEKISTVFHLELSNSKIAQTISRETGAKVLEFHSAHNISEQDFKNNVTYVDLFKRNIEVLKEALA